MFKKGDYIVCLNTPETDCNFPKNYIFKQKTKDYFLMSELDNKGSKTNGWSLIDFEGKRTYGEWRYASYKEIQEYEKLGKPYDVTTLINKEIQYEIY